MPELWQAIRGFLAHTAPDRPRRRAARHEYRLRELLAQRFLAHVEQAVFAPGEFAALVERIARAGDRSVQRRRRGAGAGACREGGVVKVRLDHVGIAVDDAAAAMAWYRTALGLEVAHSEEVASQQVRAHFLPTGTAMLELLESTAPTSPIARFLARRGPGLHHVALAVDDIHAALAELRQAGVRLIDETPRPGAEGALVAFLHPSAAQGVLVELKQPAVGARAGRPATVPLFRTPVRHALGDLELVTLSDGFFALDGGAMFGVVPRTLWEQRLPPDDRHRIPLGMRPLIVRGERTLLIDAGCGDKMDAKSAAIYGLDRSYHLAHSLAEAGVAVDEIDLVLASHLHFDHIGGFTERRADGTPGAALSAGAATSRTAASGTTPPIRTSATGPATCPRTSCRSRTPAC